jgi:heptosyltransferase-1
MRVILLVKTSSLGDVVHNLPAASDISAAYPEADIDWVVEETFAAIPRLHPAVRRVIPAAIRRWRGAFWRAAIRGEMRAFRAQLRACAYDAVIDTQGLLKSALIARAARGPRHGLDWASSREPLRLFYDRTYRVPWGQHAVARNRGLAAQALGYAVPERVNYGISAPRGCFSWLPARPYVVMLHATSAARKLWPETNWIEFGRALARRGVDSVLPWGDAKERARSERLAAAQPAAVVPPALALDEAAALLAGARAVVGVDTGLTHLAAALGTPTIGIFCATDPAATGLYGCASAINLGSIGKPPTVDELVFVLDRMLAADSMPSPLKGKER